MNETIFVAHEILGSYQSLSEYYVFINGTTFDAHESLQKVS